MRKNIYLNEEDIQNMTLQAILRFQATLLFLIPIFGLCCKQAGLKRVVIP